MDSATAITRDDARSAWAASGLTYDALTKRNVTLLQDMINIEMHASGLLRGTYRAWGARVWMSGPDKVADIRCNAFYFKKRQAVTFERNGFVGFAGWADDTNVVPIVRGFIKWLEAMKRDETTSRVLHGSTKEGT
jgi:hypothetical protein